MRLRVGRYTSVVLLALMLPCAGNFAKAQDPPVPPLYSEYRDFVLPDQPDLFIRLTIVPRFYMAILQHTWMRLQLFSGAGRRTPAVAR